MQVSAICGPKCQLTPAEAGTVSAGQGLAFDAFPACCNSNSIVPWLHGQKRVSNSDK